MPIGRTAIRITEEVSMLTSGSIVLSGDWMVVVKKGAMFCNGNGVYQIGDILDSTVVSVLKREIGEEELLEVDGENEGCSAAGHMHFVHFGRVY